MAAARERVERNEHWSVDLAWTGLFSGRGVLDMDRVTVGHVPGRLVLTDFDLSVAGPARIAVAGPNGRANRRFWHSLRGA